MAGPQKAPQRSISQQHHQQHHESSSSASRVSQQQQQQHQQQQQQQQQHHQQQQQSMVEYKYSQQQHQLQQQHHHQQQHHQPQQQQQQSHHHQQSQQHQQLIQHVEISVDDDDCQTTTTNQTRLNNKERDDDEQQDVKSCEKKVRYSSRHHHQNRSLVRRFIGYVRNAWTAGVNFSSSNDNESEDTETPIRYRPDSLSALCQTTRFSESELKRIYRGFKAECPTGVVREDTFKLIYSQFFPQGANTGPYAHYVFNTIDQDHSGIVSFEEFVQSLSVLSRGSIDEKLQWTFSLYDINGDGYITRNEMTDIVTAIYELMGRQPDTGPDETGIKDKVETIFQKMDVNGDGVVTLGEFLECCQKDDAISRSMAVFDTTF